MEVLNQKWKTSADEKRIVDNFQRLIPALILLNERVARKLEILPLDLQVLHLIVLQNRPVTPSMVTALSDLPPSSTTRVLDRLEAQGFIRRSVDRSDQRKIQIEVNWKKVAPVKARFNDFAAAMRSFTASFSGRDQATIARFMTGLVALL